MISFEGYEKIIDTVFKNKQEHVFEYWNELSKNDKIILLDELKNINFELLARLYKQKTDTNPDELNFIPAPYISLPESDKEKSAFETAKKTGKEYISKGKAGVLMVAGGQGTRLGYEGPKGMFRLSPVKNKSLFQIHAEKILKYSRKYNIPIPWLIMTSTENHTTTVQFFEKNKFFGLQKENVLFFTQKMIPSLDTDGKLMLQSKNSLCMNPDGHGGTLDALSSSGILKELKKRKIETISYFQVDNPLVNILDPVFIGFHILNDSDVSSKGVMKASPDEKVGVFVKFNDGKSGVVEYSDMPNEKKTALDSNGKLLFHMGSIAIHLFKTNYIESIVSGNSLSLQYHIARKKITALKNGEKVETNALKYEKFIFDALKLTDKNTFLETKREEEFAPVKNATGVDSPDSAIELMSNLHLGWIRSKGIAISEKIKVIEISPLLAVEADDIPDNISIPASEKVYLE